MRLPATLLPALALALASTSLFAQTAELTGGLTVDRIFGHGPLAGEPPSGITWSPDGKHLTYIAGGELLGMDPETGETKSLVSRTKLGAVMGSRAGQDEADSQATYFWAPDSRHLLFDSRGRLWLYDLHTATGIEVGTSDAGQRDDPKFSPSGQWISYIRQHGVTVVRPGEFFNPAAYPVAPASGSDHSISSGEVDWVYGEELETRSNYAWAPDSHAVLFLQMNETDVPQFPIADWIPAHASIKNQRYPQAGDLNPEVRLGLVGTSGGHVNWIRLPIATGQDYVPRFGWVDRHIVWFETLSRDHKRRALYFAEPAMSQVRQVLEITDDKFLQDQYDITVENGAIVATSWKDGHTHIYLWRYNAAQPMTDGISGPTQLTQGSFDVSAVSNVDTGRGIVEYASNEGNPLEQQVWQVSFKGERKALTTEAGFHEANFSPNGKYFVDNFSTRTTPPRLSLCEVDGPCKPIWKSESIDEIGLHAPELLTSKTKDGTVLYSTLMMPEGKAEPGSVPLIVNPYGGPGPQTVINRWGENFWADDLGFDALLAGHGFAVLRTDNRGMGGRGREFAQAAFRNFGPVQLEDQLTALDAALVQYHQLDSKRIGWWGWSWGGFFTLYAMTHSDRFKAGVSVAPVTDWRNYDSIYTERYLGPPMKEPGVYRDSSVLESAPNLKGKLLLVHGTGDDNVHFENTVQFIQRLIASGLSYDLQIYPRKTHSISGSEARVHLFNRILEHFEQNLKGSSRP